MTERFFPTPELSEEMEQLLASIQKVHLGDPHSFWYNSDRLTCCVDNNYARRVVFYLLLFAEDADRCRAQINADIEASRLQFEKWWEETLAIPREPRMLSHRLIPRSSSAKISAATRAANTAALLAQITGAKS